MKIKPFDTYLDTIYYHNNALVQKFSANKLLEYTFGFKNILEIGSGTGFLASNIAKNKNVNIVSVDTSPKMIKLCQNLYNFGNAKFIIEKDDWLDTFDFHNFDLVISNFTLQWVKNFYHIVKKIHSQRVKLVFSIPLAESFGFNISAKNINIPTYQDIKNNIEMITNSYQIDILDFTEKYKSKLHFFRHLQKLGATVDSKAKISDFRDKDEYHVDYKVAILLI